MKALEPISITCTACRTLQRDEGDPDARCEKHAIPEDAIPEYEETTLAAWGAQLPIGVPRGNPPTLGKSFALREFHFEREREIDKMRHAEGGAGNHPGKVVTTALAYMLKEWGGEAWPENKQQKHREAALLNSYMEDVLYAWIYLRAMELDPILAITTTCPVRSCKHEYVWRGDIRTIELTVSRNIIEPVPFRLSDPLTWMRQDYDTLLLTPPKWMALTQIKGSGTIADIKGDLALSTVYALANSEEPDAPPSPMSGRALDYLHKRDIERLARFVNDTFPSVDAQFELKCPECGHATDTSLDWTWDFFFGSSSLSADSTS